MLVQGLEEGVVDLQVKDLPVEVALFMDRHTCSSRVKPAVAFFCLSSLVIFWQYSQSCQVCCPRVLLLHRE